MRRLAFLIPPETFGARDRIVISESLQQLFGDGMGFQTILFRMLSRSRVVSYTF
jgi:hypothetical protein